MKNLKKKFNKIFKYFNFLIKKTLLKHPNKTNNIFKNKLHFKISNFNTYLIALIGLLFIYLFYLTIPTLYDKTWLQNSIEKKLLNEFNINFSVSSEISYEILPSPHFTVKNAKIIDNLTKKPKEVAEIKKLKIFISQKNLFYKKKLKINKVLIDSANLTIQKSDTKLFSNWIKKKFSEKKINIKNSNIFFKDNAGEIILIIQISKFFLFYDNQKKLNIIEFNGEIFKIPFTFEFSNNLINKKNTILIKAKKLKLKFENESIKENAIINGLNKISIFNSKLTSKYQLKKKIFLFESKEHELLNNSISYDGKLNLKPSSLTLNVNLEKIKLKKLFNTNSIFFEFLKTGKFFNDNISATVNFNSSEILDNKFFDSLKIIINQKNGIINFNQSEFLSKKIGLLKLDNTNLFIHSDNLIFNGDFNLNLINSSKFYTFFQTSKKLRKPIKNIFFNIDFDIFTNRLNINSLKIDDNDNNKEIQNIINNFNNSENQKIQNYIEFKNLVNQFLASYEG